MNGEQEKSVDPLHPTQESWTVSQCRSVGRLKYSGVTPSGENFETAGKSKFCLFDWSLCNKEHASPLFAVSLLIHQW